MASSEYMNIEHVFSWNMFLVETQVKNDKIKNETIDLTSLYCVLYKMSKISLYSIFICLFYVAGMKKD